jgi:hypothetical protein
LEARPSALEVGGKEKCRETRPLENKRVLIIDGR